MTFKPAGALCRILHGTLVGFFCRSLAALSDEVRGLWAAILDPKVIRLAGDDGAPMPVQSNVDGAKLAAFIAAAVADSIRELEKREDDLSKAGVTMLENVDGKSVVEQMSPQFLEFVLDAYRSLKYTR